MLIDMHVHTRFSPCSIIRIRQLPRKIQEAGIDGVCITDHDTTASLSLLKSLSDTSGICIIVGIEYTTSRGDFLIFGPVEYIPPGMSAEKILKWAKKEGGIAIPAHPFRKSRPADPGILSSFEILEVLNGRNRPEENESCANWLKRHGNNKRGIGGSDAHTLEEVGRIVTVFEKNIHGVEDLIRELRHGKYSVLQR
jgi:predicted metal-dependent phosphoesterase TrpH